MTSVLPTPQLREAAALPFASDPSQVSVDARLRLHVATLDRTITFTRHADTKAAPLLALQATLAAATVAQTRDISNLLGGSLTLHSGLSWLCLVGYAALAAVSLLLAIRVFIPATPRTGGSIVYFEDIRGMPRDRFIEAGMEEPGEELVTDILTQIHVVSTIASRKFAWLRISFIAMLGSLAFWLLLIMAARI